MSSKQWKEANRTKQVQYQREHYERNKAEIIRKAQQRKDDIRKWFRDFKSKLKCVECSENHPAAIDFHHLDPKRKVKDVTKMVAKGHSKERILEEISKCIVICANCHRKLHWKERQES